MMVLSHILPESLFAIGDLVRVQEGASFVSPPLCGPSGIYQIVALLPEAGGQHQYRIRGGADWHERVVRESQLVHASKHQRQR